MTRRTGAAHQNRGNTMLKLIRNRQMKTRAEELAQQQEMEKAKAALRVRMAELLGHPIETEHAA